MNPTLDDFWPRLTPSAQRTLRHLAKHLAERQSGAVVVVTHEGGVRLVQHYAGSVQLVRPVREYRPGTEQEEG